MKGKEFCSVTEKTWPKVPRKPIDTPTSLPLEERERAAERFRKAMAEAEGKTQELIAQHRQNLGTLGATAPHSSPVVGEYKTPELNPERRDLADAFLTFLQHRIANPPADQLNHQDTELNTSAGSKTVELHHIFPHTPGIVTVNLSELV